MKKLAITLAMLAGASVAHATFVLVPNGDFEAGGTSWSNFASGGTVISFPTTGGNTGGYGVVDNSAGDWGGGLVSPADFEYPGNNGIPLSTLGLVAGETYTFSIDMINLSGTGIGGVKFESWGDNQGGPGVPASISNSGDIAASGQSASWATYTWDYTIDPGADSIKIVPLITPPTHGGDNLASIGFDNVGVTIPEPTSAIMLGLGAMGLLVRRRRH